MASAMNKIRRDSRVEIVDDERDCGDGIMITLRQGWSFTPGEDNRCAAEDTPTDALRLLKRAQPFAGPYHD